MIVFLILLIASNVASFIVDFCTEKDVSAWYMINGIVNCIVIFISLLPALQLVYDILSFYL